MGALFYLCIHFDPAAPYLPGVFAVAGLWYLPYFFNKSRRYYRYQYVADTDRGTAFPTPVEVSYQYSLSH